MPGRAPKVRLVTTSPELDPRLLRLRDAFDQSFATAPVVDVEALEDLLAIRVADDPYALRMRVIAGLAASRKIVPLPSQSPHLLGVAGIRGSLVPVYSLAGLLGYPSASKPASWIALAGSPDAVGFGFEEFEGFLRVRSTDVHAAHVTDVARTGAGEVVRVGQQVRRVIDLPSILNTLKVRPGAAGSTKER